MQQLVISDLLALFSLGGKGHDLPPETLPKLAGADSLDPELMGWHEVDEYGAFGGSSPLTDLSPSTSDKTGPLRLANGDADKNSPAKVRMVNRAYVLGVFQD